MTFSDVKQLVAVEQRTNIHVTISLINVLLLAALCISLGSDAVAQESTRSQRSIPLPQDGADDVAQQFRIMQQLQRLMGADARKPSDSSSNTPLDDLSNAMPPLANPVATPPDSLDSQSLQKILQGLNPAQREALNDFAEQFRSSDQIGDQDGKQGEASPQQMEDILRRFLQNRRMPRTEQGSNASNFPDPQQPINNSFQQPTEQIPQPQDITSNGFDDRRLSQQPRSTTPKNSNEQLRSPQPVQPQSEKSTVPDQSTDPSQRTDLSDEKQFSPFNSNGARKGLPPNPNANGIRQPAGTNREQKPLGDSPDHRMTPEKSMQDWIRELSQNVETLPPLSTAQSTTAEQSKLGETRESDADSTPDADDSTIDSKAAERLRDMVQRGGMREALRDVFQQAQQETKAEIHREAQEKAMREAMERAAAAAKELQQLAATNEQATDSKLQAQSSDGQPPQASGNFENLQGLVDEEMVRSLIGDQKSMDKLISELQEKSRELAKERAELAKQLDSASSQSDDAPVDSVAPERSRDDSPRPSSRSSEARPEPQKPVAETPGSISNRGNNRPDDMANNINDWYEKFVRGAANTPAAEPPNAGINDADQSSDTASGLGASGLSLPTVLFVFLLAVVIGAITWWLWKVRDSDTIEDLQARYSRIMPSQINSREELIRAFHCVALGSKIGSHLWWSHSRAASTLAKTVPQLRDAISTLAGLYELARYSPDGTNLTRDQIEQANQALYQLKGV